MTERPFDSTRWKAKPISEEYNVNYDADTRKISYTDNKGLTATTDIPKEVPRVYIGILTSVQGNGYYDKSYIGLDDISGTYDTTTTTVRFVDKMAIHSLMMQKSTVSSELRFLFQVVLKKIG